MSAIDRLIEAAQEVSDTILARRDGTCCISRLRFALAAAEEERKGVVPVMTSPNQSLPGKKMWYVCGRCKHDLLDATPNYCPNCGVKLIWREAMSAIDRLIAAVKKHCEWEDQEFPPGSIGDKINNELRSALAAAEEERKQQVEGVEIKDYDAGLLNDWGGGNVSWWQDYLRSEIGRANDHWRSRLCDALSRPAPAQEGVDMVPRSRLNAVEDELQAEKEKCQS